MRQSSLYIVMNRGGHAAYLLYTGTGRTDNTGLMRSVQAKMRMLGVMLLAAVGALASCDSRSPQKPQAAEASRAVATRTSQPAATQATRTAGQAEARDYVVEPVIDPAERDTGPRRIVSMAPSMTELCWALGLGSRMVGRTQYCVYPPAAKAVEVVGALLDPNVERILTLRPDLVLITGGSSMLKEKFGALQLPVLTLPADSLEDIFTAISQLGEATGRPRTAAALVRDLRANLGRLQGQASHAAAASPCKVMFVTGALPSPARSVWVAGPGSYLDSLITLAGARNVVAGDRPWLEISTEQVLWLAPEVIVEVREPAQANLREEAVSAWRRLPGLARVRVVSLSDIGMVFPGPRVNVMLEKLIAGLYAD